MAATEKDAIEGVLLGTALGDALGLAAEGMSPRTIARRFGRVDRFHVLGRWGFVSDDTEQAALVAQSLIVAGGDRERFVRAFRRSLLGWFLRLPFGIGLSTLRACVKILVGLRESGIRSAGNGAAMRAPVVGVFFADPARASERASWSRELARVTHTDPRGVEGALFAAELAALCARAAPGSERRALVERARAVVTEPDLARAIEKACALAAGGADPLEAAQQLGTTGYVVHTIGFAAFAFARFEGAALDVLSATVGAGGDTDTIGAIVGAWLGALGGPDSLDPRRLAELVGGPFGPGHLRALATALAQPGSPPPSWSALVALARNLALYPVVLAHGLRRLVPL